MRFTSWLRSLKSLVGRVQSTRTERRQRPRRRPQRLALEILEDRVTPSTVSWINPSGGDWDTGSNWNTGKIPGASDDVVINIPGQNTFTVTHSGSATDVVNSLTSQDALVVSGGSLSLAASSTVDDLQVDGGTLLANADLTVTGPDGYLAPDGRGPYSFLFISGTLGGGGTLYLDGNTSSLLGYSSVNVNLSIVNQGTAILANVTLGSGASFTNANGAILQAGIDTILNGSGTLVNEAGGTVLKEESPTYPQYNPSYFEILVPFSNAGLVEVNSGTLIIGGGSSSSGDYTAAASTLLEFQGSQSFTAGSISSAGQVEFDGPATVAANYSVSGTTNVGGSVAFSGPVNINGTQLIDNGTADFTAASFASPLSLDDVYLNGTLLLGGDLTITGPDGYLTHDNIDTGLYSFFFNSGTLGGSGTLCLDSSTSSLLGYSGVNVNLPIVNQGTAIVANVTLGSGASFTNNNGAILQEGIDNSLTGSGMLVNEAGGTVLNVPHPTYGPNNYFAVLVPFSNAGLVEVGSGGTLVIGGGSSSTGDYTAAAGTVLDFQGTQSFTAGSTISADSGSMVEFYGVVTTNGATLALTGGGSFQLLGGTLVDGTATLTAGSSMQIAGGTLDNFALENAGAMTWTSGTVEFTHGASFTNAATGIFNDQTDGTFGGDGSYCPAFTNQGLFVKSGGTGTTYLNMMLYNSGKVEVQSGTLSLGCDYYPSGGTITGPVTAPGTSNSGEYPVVPSQPISVGTFTQTATGDLYEEIGGYAAGTQYGQIDVLNSVALAGTLHVVLINGFTPKLGDQFEIINNQGSSPVSGTFAGYPEGATVWSGQYGFTITYAGAGGNNVVLTLTQIQYPTAVALASDHPSGSVYGQMVTFTATVSATTAPSVTPTGSVQFLIDGSDYGTPVSLAGGSGSVMANLPAGSHSVTADYTSASPSFANSDSAPFTAIVSPATLSVTASAQTKTYGQSLTFGSGSTQFSNSGLQNGETIGSVTLAVNNNGGAATAPAGGSYTITPSAATGGTFTPSNYTITYNTGTLTVNKYTFTYTIPNDSQTYGSPANFATDLGTAITTGVNGEKLDIAYSSTGDTATAAAGTYSITCVLSNGTGLLSNYSVTLQPGTLTVTTARAPSTF